MKREGCDSRAVVNHLIDIAEDDGRFLTPLQIIKLVYFCHGWMLGLYGRSLIRHHVLAWQYGPVIAEVYHKLKHRGGEQVVDKIEVADEVFGEEEEDLIGQVHSYYGHLSGIELSRLTHAPGTPWHTIWSRSGKNAVIPNGLIKSHYEERANSG